MSFILVDTRAINYVMLNSCGGSTQDVYNGIAKSSTRPALFILRIVYHLPACKIFWQVLNVSTYQSTFQETQQRLVLNLEDGERARHRSTSTLSVLNGSASGLMYMRAIHWSFVNHSSSWTIKPGGMNPGRDRLPECAYNNNNIIKRRA